MCKIIIITVFIQSKSDLRDWELQIKIGFFKATQSIKIASAVTTANIILMQLNKCTIANQFVLEEISLKIFNTSETCKFL